MNTDERPSRKEIREELLQVATSILAAKITTMPAYAGDDEVTLAVTRSIDAAWELMVEADKRTLLDT